MDIGTSKLSDKFEEKKIGKVATYILGREIKNDVDFEEAILQLYYFSYRQFDEPLHQGDLKLYQDTSNIVIRQTGDVRSVASK